MEHAIWCGSLCIFSAYRNGHYGQILGQTESIHIQKLRNAVISTACDPSVSTDIPRIIHDQMWIRQVWEVPWECSFLWNAGNRWPVVTWHQIVPSRDVPISVFGDISIYTLVLAPRGIFPHETVNWATQKVEFKKLVGPTMRFNFKFNIKK